jgi:opacity protein-like surface antigen
MLTRNTSIKIFFLFITVLAAGRATAQVSMYDADRRGSVYIGIGSNTATHRPSTIEITQGTPGFASSYTLDQVAADSKTTSKSAGFAYNVKVGYFFDYNQTFAVELSYEPVKYHVTDGQKVKLKGTVDNAAVDTSFAFSAANGYFYNIDGSNMIAINLVKRFQLLQIKSHNVRLDALVKGGGGPAMPHVFNSIKGKVAEYPSFQLGGWNAGLEAALRLTIMRHVYVEGGYRYSYASYNDIGVYSGTATQKLSSSQVIFTAGYTFATTKRNPLFTRPERYYRPLTIKPIYPEPLDVADPEPAPAPEPAPETTE